MKKLKTYSDFLNRANELGFFPLSGRFLEGIPTVALETEEDQWHTGDPDTDPWQWKDRAAQEKQMAFGCILGGQKGFIAPKLYPLFLSACQPAETVEERYDAGELNETVWKLYGLFENGAVLSTADVRKKLGVTPKSGAGRVDSALKQLQREFVITVCGNKRKISLDGLEYGWPANAYCLAENWVPAAWLESLGQIKAADARKQILDTGCSFGNSVDRAKLSKRLFGLI